MPPVYLLWSGMKIVVKVSCKQLIKVACVTLAFVNTMRAVWISHHRQVLIVFDQFVY